MYATWPNRGSACFEFLHIWSCLSVSNTVHHGHVPLQCTRTRDSEDSSFPKYRSRGFSKRLSFFIGCADSKEFQTWKLQRLEAL